MSQESPLMIPAPIQNDRQIIMPALEAPVQPPSSLAREPGQARAVEALFAAQERESDQVAGLLTLWTGTLVLHDLALENFSPAAGELEEEEELRRKQALRELPPVP